MKETEWRALEKVLSEALNLAVSSNAPSKLRFMGEHLLRKAAENIKVELSPTLQALHNDVEAALAKEGHLNESHAATTGSHKASLLPIALREFKPLADDVDVKAAVKGLQALELAVAQNPTTAERLRPALHDLDKLLGTKIKQRTEGVDLQTLVTECERAITAGNRDFEVNPISSHPIPLHPMQSNPVQSYSIAVHLQSRPTPSHPLPSHPIPSRPVRSHPISSHPISSHPCKIPSRLTPSPIHAIPPIPSHPILPQPTNPTHPISAQPYPTQPTPRPSPAHSTPSYDS